MSNCITRHIPNTVTCCNLLSGCVAIVMAHQGCYQAALGFIVLGAIFDFFDGLLARALKAYSPLGKELDSLADDVTFGVAPAMMVFSLMHEVALPAWLAPVAGLLPYAAFLIAAFSALRLAKFNIDTRQTTSFIGLPTPANALFWGSLIVGAHDFLVADTLAFLYLIILVLLTSWLLVAEIPMFSLKFKNLSWRDNKVQFIFLLGCIPLVLFLQLAGLAAVIIWYALLSLLTQRKS
ncbi:MAG: CDP-diacylglycerol--serine O-phosphatidyltransferase [Bacteroidaceae bacterium]|nr:CDP-diacylglycerol--serine O-phosphatidyltransferase [Bacteroidaceae bacterium]MBQ8190757.1 CDP-diacylglycerol--serine O-phosphatidyltransferase [Bacteroidaceae bacterium]MBR6589054.1 CDP-diacylglycerol--serine O-phosphatidyltransferase [Bacteroidaceae bacterium]